MNCGEIGIRLVNVPNPDFLGGLAIPQPYFRAVRAIELLNIEHSANMKNYQSGRRYVSRLEQEWNHEIPDISM